MAYFHGIEDLWFIWNIHTWLSEAVIYNVTIEAYYLYFFYNALRLKVFTYNKPFIHLPIKAVDNSIKKFYEFNPCDQFSIRTFCLCKTVFYNCNAIKWFLAEEDSEDENACKIIQKCSKEEKATRKNSMISLLDMTTQQIKGKQYVFSCTIYALQYQFLPTTMSIERSTK